MSNFDTALIHTLLFEGGKVNDPDDPGGATNKGISLRFLASIDEIDKYDYNNDGEITPIDIMNLKDSQIRTLYKEYFWLRKWDELDTKLATKLFDFSVNMGQRQAIQLFQQAVGCRAYDGVYGPKTHRYALTVGGNNIDAYVQEAIKFYYNLCERRPASRKYLYGWMRRAYSC